MSLLVNSSSIIGQKDSVSNRTGKLGVRTQRTPIGRGFNYLGGRLFGGSVLALL